MLEWKSGRAVSLPNMQGVPTLYAVKSRTTNRRDQPLLGSRAECTPTCAEICYKYSIFPYKCAVHSAKLAGDIFVSSQLGVVLNVSLPDVSNQLGVDCKAYYFGCVPAPPASGVPRMRRAFRPEWILCSIDSVSVACHRITAI